MNNIYEKYCNNIQNPALGSIIISLFAYEFHRNSILHRNPNLLYAFILIPLLMNKDMRSCIVNEKCGKASNNIYTLLSKLMKNEKTFNNIHSYVEKFKTFTMASVLFGLKTELFSIDNDANIVSKLNKQKYLPKDNIYIKGATVLGEYFANGISLKELASKLEVLF